MTHRAGRSLCCEPATLFISESEARVTSILLAGAENKRNIRWHVARSFRPWR